MISNSTITNTTFKRNVELLTILNATIDRCEFNNLINNATITGLISRCQFEGLSGGIQVNGPLDNMTILEDITPSSAQWVQELDPAQLRSIQTLTISLSVVPRLVETSHKDCFIKSVTTDDGVKVVFWVLLITDDNTPSGVILMWSGSIEDVPKGYGICDGRTIDGRVMPNLSGRFIRMIDTNESTGPKDNSELSSNGLDTRTSYIQILDYNLPAHLHTFNISADIDVSGLSTNLQGSSYSQTYYYVSNTLGNSVKEGEGSSVSAGDTVSTGSSTISFDWTHSHSITGTASLTNVQVTLNDATYENRKINVDPNAYALIFIMKL